MLMDKQRLFVDMDGTLAVFKRVDELETLYEKGYFLNLEPHINVVKAIKEIIGNHPDIEVNVLSAYLTDSKYALDEKNAWLDRYLPELPKENRVFVPCGANKRDSIEGGVRPDDFLLDDYTKNLNDWQPPARGIKLINAINHTRGSWSFDRIRFDRNPKDLALGIVGIMKGKERIIDEKYPRPEKLTGFEYVAELPRDMQDKIENAVKETLKDIRWVNHHDALDNAMSSKLNDLTDCIDWKEVLGVKPEKVNIKDMIKSGKSDPEPPKTPAPDKAKTKGQEL